MYKVLSYCGANWCLSLQKSLLKQGEWRWSLSVSWVEYWSLSVSCIEYLEKNSNIDNIHNFTFSTPNNKYRLFETCSGSFCFELQVVLTLNHLIASHDHNFCHIEELLIWQPYLPENLNNSIIISSLGMCLGFVWVTFIQHLGKVFSKPIVHSDLWRE